MKFFNVSIHDVAGKSIQEVQKISDFLYGLGITKITYLIIPHYHGCERLDNFKNKIKELVRNQEVVLHGYTHKGNPTSRFSYKKLLTDGEGEFISYNDLQNRIRLGISIFDSIGIKAVGFIPPAWLIKKKNISKIKGFDFLNTRCFIYDFKNNVRYLSPVLVFSSRGILQSLSINAFKPSLMFLSWVNIIRIAIHPCDLQVAKKMKLLEETIIKLKSKRSDIHFSEYIRVVSNS